MRIEVHNLIAGRDSKILIRNLTFRIAAPSFVAVLGHNGAGKTTFFRTLAGKLPFQGTINYNEHLNPASTNLFATGILAFLEQKNGIQFDIKVLDLVVMGRYRIKKMFQNYQIGDYEASEQVLDQMGISHLKEKSFHELSGGEQQLVWLAQMLAQDASIMLLDEPTQHLDLYNKRKVFDLMDYWVKTRRKTVFCITHDLYHLFTMEGYLLNLSFPEPELMPLTKTNLSRSIDFLEKKVALDGRPSKIE